LIFLILVTELDKHGQEVVKKREREMNDFDTFQSPDSTTTVSPPPPSFFAIKTTPFSNMLPDPLLMGLQISMD
jgi:hypothetical protein